MLQVKAIAGALYTAAMEEHLLLLPLWQPFLPTFRSFPVCFSKLRTIIKKSSYSYFSLQAIFVLNPILFSLLRCPSSLAVSFLKLVVPKTWHPPSWGFTSSKRGRVIPLASHMEHMNYRFPRDCTVWLTCIHHSLPNSLPSQLLCGVELSSEVFSDSLLCYQ